MTPQSPKIVPAEEVENKRRISPMQSIIDEIKEQGEFYTMRETAVILGVHIETLRRLCRSDRVKAPSQAAKIGKLVIYLFTPEDHEELKNYFDGKDYKQNALGAPLHGKFKTDKVR